MPTPFLIAPLLRRRMHSRILPPLKACSASEWFDGSLFGIIVQYNNTIEAITRKARPERSSSAVSGRVFVMYCVGLKFCKNSKDVRRTGTTEPHRRWTPTCRGSCREANEGGGIQCFSIFNRRDACTDSLAAFLFGDVGANEIRLASSPQTASRICKLSKEKRI